MPRLGAEPARRQALLDSAVELIGEHGSLDVPVKEIARHAGMSPALAFHYFGGKDQIVIETMRHLLRGFTGAMAACLRDAQSPAERLEAVLETSFSPAQFEQRTIAAWLVFYLHAHSSPGAARLLAIYFARLNSNLMSALLPLTGDRARAAAIAGSAGALIDGIYIRQALGGRQPDREAATEMCRRHLQGQLAALEKRREAR